MRIYARDEVRYLWLIDPRYKTLEVSRLESGKWLLLDSFTGNDKVRAEPFQEVEFDLGNLWPNEVPYLRRYWDDNAFTGAVSLISWKDPTGGITSLLCAPDMTKEDSRKRKPFRIDIVRAPRMKFRG